MIYAFSISLIVFNVLISLLKIKNKKIQLFFKSIILFFMWILYWGNYTSADYDNYKWLYKSLATSSEWIIGNQPGFAIFMKIGSILNLDYNQFLLVVSFISFWLIIFTVEKYSHESNIVYVFYFISPFILDVVQVKHFLSMSIIIYSLKYLEKRNLKNDIKFVIMIFLAMSIHYVALFFLPLVLLNKIKPEQIKLIVLSLFIALSIFVITGVFKDVVYLLFNPQKMDRYFLINPSFGVLFVYIVQSFIIFSIILLKKFLNQKKISNNFINLVYKINIYSFLLFPLYFINVAFIRGFRILMIPNYIFISYSLNLMNNRNRIIIIFFSFLFILFLLFFFSLGSSFKNSLIPIFENNLIFDLL
ncbi:EpsG-like putative glucosyltransferase [Halanaerobium saccharolyticum]|uniref:EpsG-like putative glucosyltransferase n=1 Tax=Halanaerobium saccharolyticum TaxID=43595 RepID=A0A4R6LZ52_9FIRM|nr:EpsG family protein [Halanaerobium saccharolyticum]TDO94093.1 EpsG-like putative glucosyltransferase [Halanaerobium saccharolyticum]